MLIPHAGFDSFTEALIELFPSVAEIKTGECMLTLYTIAIAHYLTMSRIECRHAAIRRSLLAKNSTHTGGFMSTSSDWILMRQRKIEDMAHKISKSLAEQQVPNTSDMEDLPFTRMNAVGPCRAWMKEWLQTAEAHAMETDALRLAAGLEAYRSIKAEQGEKYQQLVKEGKRLTLAKRAPSDVPPSQAQRAQQDILNKSLASREITDRATPAHAINAFSGMQAQHVAENMALVAQDVSEHRAKAASKRKLLEENMCRAIIECSEVPEARRLAPSDGSAGSGLLRSSTLPMGGKCHVTAQRWAPILSDKITAAMEHLGTCKTAAMKDISYQWEQGNQLLKAADAPVVEATPASRAHCAFAGFCVCHKPWLRSWVCKLQKVCRKWFHKGTEALRLLDNGLAVLHIQSVGNRSVNEIVHVSHANRSTWIAALRKMKQEDADDCRQQRAEPQRLLGALL